MFEALVVALFGLILGSFANVLILREETGETIMGRSHCPHCERSLEWYELFPVLSFLALRGKCRTCAARISWQYPIIEALTAGAFVVIALAPTTLALKLIGVPIILLLICISVFDLRTMYIPDRWAYCFAGLAFIYGVLMISPDWEAIVLFILAAPLVAAPLAALWFFSGGKWMGLGDVKLVPGFGWLLGLVGGYLALALAFVLGAIIGLMLIGITRFAPRRAGFTMKSEVPFGPFLILALCIVWFSQLYAFDLLDFLLRFLSLN